MSGATEFTPINTGYNHTFRPERLSVGLVLPIESYSHSAVPTMADHIQTVQLAEQLGFKALWLRDIPFDVPSFGDAGHTYDPWVYLGLLAGSTQTIALGVASIILPLRHPAHIAKAAATADVLSNGRFILGVASGDRPDEYPAMNIDFNNRSQKFRDSVEYIRHMDEDSPRFENDYGQLRGNITLLPKPVSGRLPLLITGGSQQSTRWIAEHGDGWMLYPRNANAQAHIINEWRAMIKSLNRPIQPVMEPLYIDLAENPDTPPRPIHLGFHMGSHYLKDYLQEREQIGVNHVSLNLRFNQTDITTTLKRLADDVLPNFT